MADWEIFGILVYCQKSGYQPMILHAKGSDELAAWHTSNSLGAVIASYYGFSVRLVDNVDKESENSPFEGLEYD